MEKKRIEAKEKKKNNLDERINRFSLIIEALLESKIVKLDDIVELYTNYGNSDNKREHKARDFKKRARQGTEKDNKAKKLQQLYRRDLEDLVFWKLIQKSEMTFEDEEYSHSEKVHTVYKLNPDKNTEWDKIRSKSDVYSATYRIIGMHILTYEYGIPVEVLSDTKIDGAPFGKIISLFTIDGIENIPKDKRDEIGKDIEDYLNSFNNMKKSGYSDVEIIKELKPLQNKLQEKADELSSINIKNDTSVQDKEVEPSSVFDMDWDEK